MIGLCLSIVATGVGLAVTVARAVRSWRDETAAAVGKLATLVGDWLDSQDDRLSDLESGYQSNAGRLSKVEVGLGLPPTPALPHPRRRSRPRRLDVLEAGLEVSESPAQPV